MDEVDESDRMRIRVERWAEHESRFKPWEEWTVLEPWAYRTHAEWFGIVSAHIPRTLTVGTYRYALELPNKLVSMGEFAWDGEAATRREGASAP